MADGQSIFGVDTARYQPLGTYDPGAFEIVNFEDPQLAAKTQARHNAGIPWGVYLWVYPGTDMNAAAQRMVDGVRGLGFGEPPAGYWADYEQTGITPDELGAFFAGTDAKGVKAGYYSGPTALNHGPFLNRPWWNAAYPTGAVEFPGYGSLWASSRPRPMNLWQYTSAGGLDRDVVVDEPWWAVWTGAAAPSPVQPSEEDEDMKVKLVKYAGDPNGVYSLTYDPSNKHVGVKRHGPLSAAEQGALAKAGLVEFSAPGVPVIHGPLDADQFTVFE